MQSDWGNEKEGAGAGEKDERQLERSEGSLRGKRGGGMGGEVRRELRGAVRAEGTSQPRGGEGGAEARGLRGAREGRRGSEELRGGDWLAGVVSSWGGVR